MKKSVKLGWLVVGLMLGVSGVSGEAGVVKYKSKNLVTSKDVDEKLKELNLKDAPRDQVFLPVLLQLAEERLVAQKIKDSKLDSDKKFQQAAAANEKTFKRNYFYREQALAKITPQMRQSVYEQMKATVKGKKEVQPKIIVLTDENKAKEVHGKLLKGECFETLAKAHSIDPSKGDGGKIGRFLPEEAFSPEVTKVLSELKEGVPSKPVKSASPSGDVHIIVQIDKGMRRDRVLPPIDSPEVKQQIDEILIPQLVGVVQTDYLRELEVYDLQGNKLPLVQEKKEAQEGIPLIGGGMKTN